MITRALLTALARRWYVVAAALVLTAAVAHHLGPARQVFWIRADVVFLPPDRTDGTGNALEGEDQSLVYFAAAVEREVNRGAEPLRLASTDATIYGAGTYRGQTVILPNAGSQWQASYNRPVLGIQVVDATAAASQARFERVLDRILAVVRDRQAEAGVGATELIRTRLAPDAPTPVLVTGSTRRAEAGVLLLGSGLAVALGLGADRLAATVRRRRTRSTEVWDGVGDSLRSDTDPVLVHAARSS